MIVVTGAGRTGTSMMMQTLKLLGVDIVGHKFHADFPSEKMNPRGYWDMPIAETINGYCGENKPRSAIKLFGFQFFITAPEYVEKVIVCRRNKQKAVVSFKKLLDIDHEIHGLENTKYFAELAYDENYKYIDRTIGRHPHLSMDFESMLSAPEQSVKMVADFVESNYDLKDAVENIGG